MIDRRDFLKTASAILAGLGFGGPLVEALAEEPAAAQPEVQPPRWWAEPPERWAAVGIAEIQPGKSRTVLQVKSRLRRMAVISRLRLYCADEPMGSVACPVAVTMSFQNERIARNPAKVAALVFGRVPQVFAWQDGEPLTGAAIFGIPLYPQTTHTWETGFCDYPIIIEHPQKLGIVANLPASAPGPVACMALMTGDSIKQE